VTPLNLGSSSSQQSQFLQPSTSSAFSSITTCVVNSSLTLSLSSCDDTIMDESLT
jgi:hypothetical protein